MPHPIRQCTYLYFTFISDRDKGLRQALVLQFPNNHCTSCAVHIQANLRHKFGSRAAAKVSELAKTFSTRREDEILQAIGRTSNQARAYIVDIEPKEWRSTEWIRSPALPPRYGITSSNMSESTNSMFNEARDLAWYDCMDWMLDKMSTRISTLRIDKKKHSGVVPLWKNVLQKRFDVCAGFTVLQLEENEDKYKVVRTLYRPGESARVHYLCISAATCTCGKWQDFQTPCVDAVAFFRLNKQMSLQQIMDNHASSLLRYEAQSDLLIKNIVPVIREQLSRDGQTLPPKDTGKRMPGRPKEKRLRKRTKHADSNQSTVLCSRCRRPGHNARTCSVDLREIAQVMDEEGDIVPDPDER